jgi:hypothetical protein
MTKAELVLKAVEAKLIPIRNQKILIASDVANLYGVGTRDSNKSDENNPDKFPEGCIFEITKEEKSEVVENSTTQED